MFCLSHVYSHFQEASQAVAVQKSGSSGLSYKSESSIHSLHKATLSLKVHPGTSMEISLGLALVVFFRPQ